MTPLFVVLHIVITVLFYIAGMIVGIVLTNRRAKFIERIMRGSLNSPLTREVKLGKIRRIEDDGVGMIKLDHPADTDNFEVGDYIRAMCGRHDRFAIARVIMRDRTRGMIQVGTGEHPRKTSSKPLPDTPYDWQPGDVLMPFDPVV